MVHPVDLAVLVVYLAGAVALGIALGRRTRSLEGYLLAQRSLPAWAILGSLVATETSTATVLSVPGETFVPGGDFRFFFQLGLGLILGRALIVWTLLPGFFRRRVFSAYEVLRHRFGPSVQRTLSLVFLVARNVGDGLRLYLAALALSMFLGWGLPWCVLLIGAATLYYTYQGGMRSVVWNDCVQLVIYLLGAALALGWIVTQLPQGWQSLWEFGLQQGKFRFLDFSFSWTDKRSFWVGLIGGAFLTLGTHGTDQMMVQRLLSTRHRRGAAWALVASGVVVWGQFLLFLLLGVALAAGFAYDPPDQKLAKGDEAFAYFISHRLPQGWGVVGLMIAAVFAASMSTLSSSLNASATVVVSDFLRPRFQHADKQPDWVQLSRRLTAGFAALQVAIALLGSAVESVVNSVLTVASFTAGAMLGVFALGLYFPQVGAQAALVGMGVGLGVLGALFAFTSVAYPLYAVLGAGATVAAGLVWSFLFPQATKTGPKP